jgi:hypothetical protein
MREIATTCLLAFSVEESGDFAAEALVALIIIT